MNFIKILYIAILSAFNIYATGSELHSYDSNCLNIPFKIGFEFQEVNGLCPWGLQNIKFQKKPIFSFNKIMEYGVIKKLWHVELDTNDIEFVTVPFSFEEQELLSECIKTIVLSIEILKNLLNEDKNHNGLLFEKWIDDIEQIFPRRVIKLNHHIIVDKLINSQARKNGKEYIPHFTPQFTLQHPLEYTIFLYFGLFGGVQPRDVLRFVDALPFRDLFIKAMREADADNVKKILYTYVQKGSGLIFLHALTLLSMIPDEETLRDPLLGSISRFDLSFQVDAKSNFTLMSRRPFSSMYADMFPKPEISYIDFFNIGLQNNERYKEGIKSFLSINYGEQFFNESGEKLNLERYLQYFDDMYLSINREKIQQLLQNGIITITMLRKMKGMESCIDTYLEKAISIHRPLHPHMYLDVLQESPKLKSIESQYDALSPPWFLDSDDAMGNIKENVDKKFGEAIVEVRGVSGIGSWFFRKMKIDPNETGVFLSDYSKFFQHSMFLFDYIKSLTKKDFSDISEGIKYTIIKF